MAIPCRAIGIMSHPLSQEARRRNSSGAGLHVIAGKLWYAHTPPCHILAPASPPV